jgi:multidrug efflux system membrane fusion protein
VWILIALAAAAAYFLMQRHEGTRTPSQASRLMTPGATPVATATAKKGNIGVYLEAIGTVTPVYTASITSQVNGLVIAVHYTEGQIVHKGDPLIDIDPRPFQAQVLQAQGTLERDLNVLAQAKMDLERFRAAWARNAIPKQQLDDQEKLVLQDEGQVKSDQGNLQFLQVQLGWSHITAPFTGRAGLRLVDPGNVVVLNAANQVNVTTSLVVITETQPITVVFTLAEDNLSEVRAETRRRASLPVYAFDRALLTKIATGVLTAIDNQIDTTTGTVKLRATFDNADDALFPNQFVNTRLLVKTLNGVTTVPSQAIQHNGPATFLYVIRDGEAHIQNVKTGVTDAGMTVVEGIRAGTVVATSNFDKLQNAVPVTPVTKPAPAGAKRARKP